jgi:hypothetical protein
MEYTFQNCINLETIDGQLDLSSVTSCAGLFSGCTNLKSIPALNLSNLSAYISNTSTVNTELFKNCENLTSLKITDMKSTTSMKS